MLYVEHYPDSQNYKGSASSSNKSQEAQFLAGITLKRFVTEQFAFNPKKKAFLAKKIIYSTVPL